MFAFSSPQFWGKFWGPFWGLKLDRTWSWRRRQLSTSSIILAVKTHTHCVVRARSHQLPTAEGEPWGYVDMVLASMRFPDLSLGPYKRDSTTKPFAELRSFVMCESPSLVAPLASWFRTSGRFQRLVSNARVLSGPVRVLVSDGRVLSAPVRVLLGSRFQCSGPIPRLSFTLITQCGVGWGV